MKVIAEEESRKPLCVRFHMHLQGRLELCECWLDLDHHTRVSGVNPEFRSTVSHVLMR